MRAVTFSRFGGPEVLEVSELSEPKPGPGEVRIRVAAATVNPTDISFRTGRQQTTAQLAQMGVLPPYIPGMELAGVVDATRIAQDGLAAARQRGEREVEGHVLRLLGDIAAHPDRFEVDTAEAHYRQALALAEALGLRPLVAHCPLGLGKLYRRAGTRQQAREHITTAGTMFGEMDMRYWLTQAEAELKELA